MEALAFALSKGPLRPPRPGGRESERARERLLFLAKVDMRLLVELGIKSTLWFIGHGDECQSALLGVTLMGIWKSRIITTKLDAVCVLPNSASDVLVNYPRRAKRALVVEKKHVRRPTTSLGGLGGFPPHYRAYLAPCAPRGGVWGGPSPPL